MHSDRHSNHSPDGLWYQVSRWIGMKTSALCSTMCHVESILQESVFFLCLRSHIIASAAESV